MITPPAAPAHAGQRLLRSRARLRAELARPPTLPLESWLDGAEPGALAWRWARSEADRRLGEPVRAHPELALGLAFGAGVLLALARPWRWRLMPGLRLVSPLLLSLLTRPPPKALTRERR